MKIITVAGIAAAAVVFALVWPEIQPEPSACESKKCISIETSSAGCDENGQRLIDLKVINTAGDAAMDYKLNYDSKSITLQGNKWAQVLGPGESRHHTFTTAQGLAKQITIVAQQVGNEGNFKESYLVKPC